MRFLKKFTTTSDYNTFVAGQSYETPNVSLVQVTNNNTTTNTMYYDKGGES